MPARRRKPAAPVEWVGGTVPIPTAVTDGGEPYRPAALLWLDPGGLRITGFEIGRPEALPGLAAEHLRRTIATPLSGPPGAPARLRVDSDALADALRGAFPDLEIVVAPTPELDEAGEGLASVAGGAEADDPGWIGEGLSPDAVGAFFDAMAALWRAAPWHAVPGDDAPFRVDVEALDATGAVAVVIGQMGESFGVILCASLDDYDRFVEASEAMEAGDVRAVFDAGMPAHLALNYDPIEDVTTVRREERETHGWALAGEGAFPSLIALEEGLVRRAPSARELVLAEALARAFARVADGEGFEPAWEDGEPVERTLRVPTHGGEVEVRLGAPVFADDEADEIPSRDPEAVPECVYRLKLELEHIRGEVSRTVELAGDHTLWDLHGVIQDAFDWDDDHLFGFFVSGKLRDRKSEYVGCPLGDVESFDFGWGGRREEPRSVTGTRLDDLGLVRRRVVRYVFDDEHLVRITVSTIRDGGPDDVGLPRTTAAVGEAPQYGYGEDED